MGDAKLLGDPLFVSPPGEFRILASQIDQALKPMGAQEIAIKTQIGLGAARHPAGYPVQMIEPVEQSGHEGGVDATLRAGKSLLHGLTAKSPWLYCPPSAKPTGFGGIHVWL